MAAAVAAHLSGALLHHVSATTAHAAPLEQSEWPSSSQCLRAESMPIALPASHAGVAADHLDVELLHRAGVTSAHAAPHEHHLQPIQDLWVQDDQQGYIGEGSSADDTYTLQAAPAGMAWWSFTAQL